LQWNDFILCQGLGAGIGVDCFGGPQSAVRYDSPTWGGFRFETSYGENQGLDGIDASDQDFWDIALFYTADWNSIKVSLAAAYTWIESGISTGDTVNLWQVGGSVMHKPSGLGIYAMGQWENPDGSQTSNFGLSNVSLDSIGIDTPLLPLPINFTLGVNFVGGGTQASFTQQNPDSDAWYIKPFWRKAWSPIGATVLYGEYGQYNDMFQAATNLCSSVSGNFGNLGGFCASTPLVISPGGFAQATVTSFPGDIFQGAFITGSEAQRFGLGVVQEIDSAAMHLWARWQHQELDTDIIGVRVTNPLPCSIDATACQFSTTKINQKWDDWDLFQVGGIIFF
jgi:hypothetical protein